MTITIDWVTKVINIPKADLTLVQSYPELRKMDLNWFRLALKDIEGSDEGMPYPDTHIHKSQTILSGLIYARFIEIINNHMEDFSKKHFSKLLKKLDVNEAYFKEAMDLIIKLNPKPADTGSGGNVKADYIIPDFIVTEEYGELEVFLLVRDMIELLV